MRTLLVHGFADKEAARGYFTRLIGMFKNLNYAADGSPEQRSYLQQIHELADSVTLSLVEQKVK